MFYKKRDIKTFINWVDLYGTKEFNYNMCNGYHLWAILSAALILINNNNTTTNNTTNNDTINVTLNDSNSTENNTTTATTTKKSSSQSKSSSSSSNNEYHGKSYASEDDLFVVNPKTGKKEYGPAHPNYGTPNDYLYEQHKNHDSTY